MKQFFTKISALFARLAFWRKPVTAQVEAPTPVIAPDKTPDSPDASTDATIAAPKIDWLARLKQMFAWRRKTAPQPLLELDQTVVVERPSSEQLASTATADEATPPKLAFFARLVSKLRRQPKHASDSAPSDASDTKADSALSTAAADVEDLPKPSLKLRVLALLHNKWVVISGAGGLVLALVVTVVVLLVSTTQEKEKLKAELLEAKKKLAHPVVVKREIPAPAALPQHLDGSKVVANVTKTQPRSVNSPDGDCVVTDKESVGQSLKDCIDNFNNLASSPRRAVNKH